ncbi:MAG: hypothetical protein WCD37_11470 [Chloroflexia bacterium]
MPSERKLWTEEFFELLTNDPWRLLVLAGGLVLCYVVLNKLLGLGEASGRRRRRKRRKLGLWNWKRPRWEGQWGRISDEELWSSDGRDGGYFVPEDHAVRTESEVSRARAHEEYYRRRPLRRQRRTRQGRKG